MLYGRTDLIPLWVADMDFATPPFILEALRERLQHPILGYTCIDDDYFPAIIDWQKSLHNWNIEKDWISFMPGVIRGLGFAFKYSPNLATASSPNRPSTTCFAMSSKATAVL